MRMLGRVILRSVLAAWGGAVLLLPPSTRADDFEFFEKRIRPVLVDRCYKCHSSDAEKVRSGFLLDSRDGLLKGGESGKPAIIPGNSESSRLVEAIRYKTEDFQMPPPKEGKLTDAQVADIIAWINLGAPDPRTNVVAKAQPSTFEKGKKHWAFQ